MKIVFLSHTIRNSIFRIGSYYLSKIFSAQGHEVLYISSPLSLAHIGSNWLGKNIRDFNKRWALRSFRRDDDKVVNHVPVILFPFLDQKLFNSYYLYNRLNLTITDTSEDIKRLGFENPDLIIQDSLKLNFCYKHFRTGQRIYRATDLYAEMPGTPPSILKAEHEAISKSDRIFATSEPLKNHLEQSYGVKATVVRNGVDYRHFDRKRNRPEEYSSMKGPICVYVGSMDERFDYDLVIKVSELKNLSVVLIGPLEEENVFSRVENIICLGEIHPEKLPAYLQHADVGVLPFKKIPANHNRSPMKIYEYGASGLPVVSTRLYEVERRESDFVLLADSDQEFVHQLQRAISNKGSISQKAKMEAKQFSWNIIADEFLSNVLES